MENRLMALVSVVFVFIGFVCQATCQQFEFYAASDYRPLNEHISYYETLNYNSQQVARRHNEVKAYSRGMSLSMAFRAHGKRFHLNLVRDTEIFSPDFTLIDELGQKIDYDLSKVYRGYLKGEENSIVHGILNNGVFYGKIYHGDEQYYVEPASMYFKQKTLFHSIIYKASHIHFQHKGGNATCGHKEHHQISINGPWKQDVIVANDRNSISSSSPSYSRIYRKKRNVLSSNANTCRIRIDADPYYTQANGGRIQTTDRLVLHVQAVDLMYRRTDFDNDGSPDNARIEVRTIAVSTTVDGNNPIHNSKLGVNALLKLYSLTNFNEFCTSFLFTHRTFENGVLGLAYVGSICNVYAFTAANTQQSTNCGLVSTQNSGATVPLRASEVTFAHELGHNFGSQHDNTYTSQPSCYPGGLNGNYIMYAYATTGNLKNNNLFSSCSKTVISGVLRDKARLCFKENLAAFCGNGVVETGEDCDCGNHCNSDKCCIPTGKVNACKFNTSMNAKCSASNGPCCNVATCQIRQASEKHVCQTAADCTDAAVCNGFVTCPVAKSKPTNTRCDQNRKLCSNGACTLSLCALYNMTECHCSGSNQECHLCCRPPYEARCISTYDLPKRFNKTNLAPGSTCKNFTGYCDVLDYCRTVNEAGPLSSLLSITSQQIGDWAARNWWVILLVCCGVALCFAIFIRFLAPLIPTDNPGRTDPKPCSCFGCSNQPKADSRRNNSLDPRV